MFIGRLSDWAQEKELLHPAIHQAMAFLQQTDFSGLENGRYDIDGDRIFCLLQEAETAPTAEKRPEAHERFLDIQYLIHGRERIGTARLNGQPVEEDLMSEKDIVFFAREMTDEIDVILEEGMYVLFTPQDIHRPCCEAGSNMTIRKAVIKIDSHILKSAE
ncbi:YhcH/YjgK/YiaL family protein [Paenibacillus sp. FSL K6-1230]|uniref:YhcH/YjgK/YiaL family protein n=1 Tax=Paenibacillus sp. FSL K6-1230 TaxID=2921603 RepID=UPI0003A970A5